MSYVTTITPLYRLEGLIKLVTALASWGTVIAIAAISPRALSMRMPEELEREIEDRKRAEAELASLNETLIERTRQLEDANAELEGFTYLVAHDLRSPLRGIVANSRVVIEDASEKLAPDDLENLERLGAAALRMSSLVDDLLDFARYGRQVVDKSIVDASRISLDIVEELKGEFPIEWEIQPNVHVSADPALLRIVLYNLFHNACKYVPVGKAPFVRFGEEETSRGVAMYVRDNGTGFDMQFIGKVFEPFERLSSAGSVPGTGIGLANVKRIVERHGGEIWAESHEGVGSTFWVRLP